MLVYTPGSTPVLHAESNVRVALIGGAPIPTTGVPHMVQASSDFGATVVITHRVRSDKQAEYEAWVDEIS